MQPINAISCNVQICEEYAFCLRIWCRLCMQMRGPVQNGLYCGSLSNSAKPYPQVSKWHSMIARCGNEEQASLWQPKLELRAWKGIVQIRLLVWHTSHFMSGLSLATTIYHHPLRVTSTDPAAPVGSGMLKQTAVGIPTCAKNKDSSPSRMQGQTL
jgi:hypothetical protein